MQNKTFWVIVTICEDRKYYSYALRVSKYENLISKLKIENLIAANIVPTKREADDLVNFWNNGFIQRGEYLFSSPM